MLYSSRSLKNETGFTLVEVLVVVVIIGILAAVAIPVFFQQQQTAKLNGVKANVQATSTNLKNYLTTNPRPTSGDIAAESNNLIINTDPKENNTDSEYATIEITSSNGGFLITGKHSAAPGATYTYSTATGEFIGTDKFS